MKFCADCFSDSEIRNIVIRSPEHGNCPVCGEKNVPLYDTAKDSSLKENFDRLLDLYTPESEIPTNIPKSELTTIIDDISENWGIFNTRLKPSQIRKILEDLCNDKIAKNRNFLSEKVVIAENYDKTYYRRKLHCKDRQMV